MRYLIDTNVLLRYCDQDSEDHSICVSAIRSLVERGELLFLCAQILIEHWAVATRPISVNGLGLSPAEVDQQLAIAALALPCLPEPSNVAELWRKIARENAVCGKQVHDARIVAVMEAHCITHIITLNTSDFTRYHSITPVTPHEILHQFKA